jgi:hypothetical protein
LAVLAVHITNQVVIQVVAAADRMIFLAAVVLVPMAVPGPLLQ